MRMNTLNGIAMRTSELPKQILKDSVLELDPNTEVLRL